MVSSLKLVPVSKAFGLCFDSHGSPWALPDAGTQTPLHFRTRPSSNLKCPSLCFSSNSSKLFSNTRQRGGACRFTSTKKCSAFPVRCSKATESAPIRINIGETSLLFPFFPRFALELESAINNLLGVFKQKEKATRPQRWESLDRKFQEELDGGNMAFEVFCNPNAYSNAFQAKVMLILKYGEVKITTEGSLSAFKADLDEYIKANS